MYWLAFQQGNVYFLLSSNYGNKLPGYIWNKEIKFDQFVIDKQ